MYFSIDRIVGNTAELVGEDGKPMQVPSSMLPRDARSGDMVRYENGGFSPAPQRAAERRERIGEMLKMLLHAEDEEE